ncbi:nitrate reductase cytochrome c-type subunit [Ideonella sp.]|uniref:nitrate reductase cytochrome c-type subunit n=1 Tax=Ideonella sp. TaxID=1929293 RepID=UPI0035ADC441
MRKPALLLLAAATAALLIGCATTSATLSAPFSGVASLRGADAATPDHAPAEAKAYSGRRPGSQQPIARTYDGQPPLVPHAIDNFDEITVDDNQCLECHAPANAAKKSAPKLADSHLAADRLAVRMERYQCNSCHVPQVDAPPLVGNRFAGHLKAPSAAPAR